MAVVNLVIALILVAVSWWAVARLLTWSLTGADPAEGSSPSGGKRRLPSNRVLATFDRPSAPLNEPPVGSLVSRAHAE